MDAMSCGCGSDPSSILGDMAEPSREDLIEELLATSGMYPGLAEHLDRQRNAGRRNDWPRRERTASSAPRHCAFWDFAGSILIVSAILVVLMGMKLLLAG